MHIITKEVYFCYGHRLMNHPGKCRNLHGHSVKASISIKRDQLNDQGMVCDFSDIRDCVESFIDEHLDHNFLLHKDDPIIPLLEQNQERFLALDEHPTAEILSKMIYQYIKSAGFDIDQVVLWETASAYACYRED
ncbi:6-pyruvoyl trahydropterin synthase family protein [Methylicorpusculum sp.]|uniref:6-pyruvoyl trahydropterin synthase family protein n=1 Tax=Methylicorpusculum sp. TaxID=2713644 RepID=UPI00271F3554|nr:6-carboxytetrahydropterin synthase [Methylicorpusculum sp.]MDO8843979.1 6-carboxytetrahydropterin synthase [Methylicorpusculum sp.]MDO9239968.1 6-carboxytetrahydropterin synthase [Methylicorpusculum sp.]MDP2177534.1 6-carboxytetrahydropterin synthase [Methylicorpusculum sp.]MDP3531570.1 6-carboxytetrahydropterin synthase [Methylicorpusculum sp.]MDZ4151124.1 6-carboxytetrahydropterin synthase [Methylicorpusculum sp.]